MVVSKPRPPFSSEQVRLSYFLGSMLFLSSVFSAESHCRSVKLQVLTSRDKPINLRRMLVDPFPLIFKESHISKKIIANTGKASAKSTSGPDVGIGGLQHDDRDCAGDNAITNLPNVVSFRPSPSGKDSREYG